MKIIVAGVTGFIGSHVLSQALAHPRVTSVIALSRKALTGPSGTHPKLTVLLMDDASFVSYPADILDQLRGASGCVWALGIASPKDMNVYRRVNLEYVRAAAETFAADLANSQASTDGEENPNKFRFAYCSGGLAHRDQEERLWFMESGRMIRGECENAVVQVTKEHPDDFDGHVLRPWVVLSPGFSIQQLVLGRMSVKVEELAAALLDSAIGGNGTLIEENKDLVVRGRAALEALKA